MRRRRRNSRENRTLRPLLEIVAETDQERLHLMRAQEQVASEQSNYEWAAVMRDEQRGLLGPDDPQAPQLGPGLNLNRLIAALTSIEQTVASLRAETDGPTGTPATYSLSLVDVERQVAQLRAEVARVATMSSAAAAQAARSIRI